VDETGNLLIIRGSIDSKEYSVPKNTVINVDKSSDKIVLYMTRDDFINTQKSRRNMAGSFIPYFCSRVFNCKTLHRPVKWPNDSKFRRAQHLTMGIWILSC
jgi:hypothetical protein